MCLEPLSMSNTLTSCRAVASMVDEIDCNRELVIAKRIPFLYVTAYMLYSFLLANLITR